MDHSNRAIAVGGESENYGERDCAPAASPSIVNPRVAAVNLSGVFTLAE
jgi:hypothetical protein